MNTSILGTYVAKKEAEKPYISLKSGESVKILKVVAMDIVDKKNFNGVMEKALELKVNVDTSEGILTKVYQNSSQKFAIQLMEKGIEVGSSFTLSRQGETFQTVYVVTDVKNPSAAATASQGTIQAAPQAATAAPAQPKAESLDDIK